MKITFSPLPARLTQADRPDLETAFVTAAGEDRSVADHHVACQGDVVTPVKVAKRDPLLDRIGIWIRS